jgi:hypothetical protein
VLQNAGAAPVDRILHGVERRFVRARVPWRASVRGAQQVVGVTRGGCTLCGTAQNLTGTNRASGNRWRLRRLISCGRRIRDMRTGRPEGCAAGKRHQDRGGAAVGADPEGEAWAHPGEMRAETVRWGVREGRRVSGDRVPLASACVFWSLACCGGAGLCPAKPGPWPRARDAPRYSRASADEGKELA